MKDKLKKVLTTTIISAVSATAIGCSTTNSKLAKNIDKSMAEFVSSINNLDYVETASPSSEKIGKIVETSTLLTSQSHSENSNQYLTNQIDNTEIENTITRPSERSDNFKLYVLSESPYISFTSDSDTASLNMYVKFSTNKIEETSDEINSRINELILKRSILMIYVNEIYNGNVNLTEENKVAIRAYVNVIKENASFLKGNRGMVKNQLNLASDLLNKDANENLVNYYIIKSGEALETRSNKIDSTISAIDSIIEILELNLSQSSPYYQKNISSTYDNILNNLKTETSNTQISDDNKALADNIAESLNMSVNHSENNTTDIQNKTNKSLSNETQNDNSINIKNLNLNTTQNNHGENKLNIRNKNNELEYNSLNNHNQDQSEEDSNTRSQRTTSNETSQNNTIQSRSRFRRRPSSQITRNRQNNINNQNYPTQNEDTNSPTISSNSNKTNSAKSVVNMNNQNNTIRAERTPETHTQEEYTSTKTSNTSNTSRQNRATRVPYRTNSTFRQ